MAVRAVPAPRYLLGWVALCDPSCRGVTLHFIMKVFGRGSLGGPMTNVEGALGEGSSLTCLAFNNSLVFVLGIKEICCY